MKSTLRKIKDEEFSQLFEIFLQKNYRFETDLLFIDLFQNGSKFSFDHTICGRIKRYIKANPKKKNLIAYSLDGLLAFLCERDILPRSVCEKERKKILDLLK